MSDQEQGGASRGPDGASRGPEQIQLRRMREICQKSLDEILREDNLDEKPYWYNCHLDQLLVNHGQAFTSGDVARLQGRTSEPVLDTSLSPEEWGVVQSVRFPLWDQMREIQRLRARLTHVQGQLAQVEMILHGEEDPGR